MLAVPQRKQRPQLRPPPQLPLFPAPVPPPPPPPPPPATVNLLQDFRLPKTQYYHDVSVDALLHLSVVRKGSALNMNLDCHRAGGQGGNVCSSSAVGIPRMVHCSAGPEAGSV